MMQSIQDVRGINNNIMDEQESTLELFLADAPDEFSLDTETTGSTWDDSAFMVSYAWESDELRSGYIDLRDHASLWIQMLSYIQLVDPNLIFHNAKFDLHMLGFYPKSPKKFDDTCLMIYLLDEHHAKGLKKAAEIILGETTDEATILKEEKKKLKLKTADGYHLLPVDVVAPYAKKDAEFTFQLYTKLSNALEKVPTVKTVYLLEKQLILDVCDIEKQGLAIDEDYIKNKIRTLGDRVVKIEKRIELIVNKPVGSGLTDFNPRSPKQVLDIFASMGYALTGTGVAELKLVNHELATLIVEMRQLNKLISTYLMPMLKEAVNKIVHPNFNLATTVTKRFSSSAAND